jgi:hypothetical protein
MASRFIGLNRGQSEFDIVDGSSTGSTDLEVRIDLTKNIEQGEFFVMLKQIENYLIKATTIRTNVNG